MPTTDFRAVCHTFGVQAVLATALCLPLMDTALCENSVVLAGSGVTPTNQTNGLSLSANSLLLVKVPATKQIAFRF